MHNEKKRCEQLKSKNIKHLKIQEYKQKNLIDRVNEIMLFRSQLTPRDNAIIDDLIDKTLNRGK